MNRVSDRSRLRVLLCLWSAGCAPDVADEAMDDVAAAESELYTNANITLWSKYDTVPVCFTLPGQETQRAQVREALQNGWESIANIRFTGFGLCPTTGDTKYVRVYLQPGDSGSYWAQPGKPLALKLPSPDPTDASVNLWAPDTGLPPATLKTNLQSQTLHEFGHTLGFSHEHDRIENAGTDPHCNPEGYIPGFVWSPYDGDSVLHYCGRRDGGLSAGDVLGAQAAYGFDQRGVPVSIPGPVSAPGQINSTLFFEGAPNKTFRSTALSDCCAGSVWGSTDMPMASVASGAMSGAPAVVLQGPVYMAFWQGRDRKLWAAGGADGGHLAPLVFADEDFVMSPPTAAISGDTVVVAYVGGDLNVYFKRVSDGTWQPRVRFVSSLVVGQPTAVSTSSGVFAVYWRGVTDGLLWQARSTNAGATWTTPSTVSGTNGGSAPRAVGHADGTTDVFWRGSDGYLRHLRRTSGGSMLPVARLNSGVMAGPGVPVLASPGRIEVYWRGSGNTLWRMVSVNGSWSAATNLNDALGTSDPSVASDGNGAIDVSWRETTSSTAHSSRVFVKRYRPTSGWQSSRAIDGISIF